ncbi:hypothetical protein DXU07_09015 [Bradyrhizobium elkanii]|nr:hypothetical protein CO675_08185 [Bradyrhizobium sp. C9]
MLANELASASSDVVVRIALILIEFSIPKFARRVARDLCHTWETAIDLMLIKMAAHVAQLCSHVA